MRTPALEVAARLFRPTLWEPKGTPVIKAGYTPNGDLVIVTGPEAHKLGTPRRNRKVFALRTYVANPPHAPHEDWGCTGFSWAKERSELEERFAELVNDDEDRDSDVCPVCGALFLIDAPCHPVEVAS